MEKQDQVLQIAQTLFIGRCIRQMFLAQAGQLRTSERLIETERLIQDFDTLVQAVRNNIDSWTTQ